MSEEKQKAEVLRNPKTDDVDRYIDAEIWMGKTGENGQPVEGKGRWVPNTSVPGQDKYDKLLAGEFGEVEQKAAPRNVHKRLSQALSRGVKHGKVMLKTNDQDALSRLLGLVQRVNISGSLPKGKPKVEYPTVDGGTVTIHLKDVEEVAFKIQDYIEDCHSNYERLISDPSLNVDSGWPE